MNKSGLLMVIVVLVAIFGIAYSQLSLNLAPPTYSRRITPQRYPALIAQSGTICPGSDGTTGGAGIKGK